MTQRTERAWLAAVADFIDRPVPDRVRAHGVRTVTDVLTATVAGTAVEEIRSVGETATFPDGPSTVIGTDRTAGPGEAALVNAAASIAQEIEEGHNEGGHVGAGTVIAGFAVAEREDLDGEAFVDACVRAYEVAARLEWGLVEPKGALSEGHPWLVRNPHATWTPVGPALAAGLCLGLDAETLLEVIRVAANLAVVSMHDPYREGAPARNFTAGFSTQAGVSAALAAAAGLSGSRAATAAVYDPVRELSGDAFDRRFAALGERWESARNYVKYAPTCRYTHPPLDALSAVRDEVDPDAVSRIDVYSFRNAVDLDDPDPTPFTGAKFSVPYVLASSLRRGDPAFGDFDPEAVADESVLALARRVRLHHDPTFESAFPERWSARVEVRHDDGRVVTGECRHPRGDHRNRADEATFREKCRDAVAWRFDDGRAESVVEACFDLPNRDVRDVGALLRAEPSGP